MPVFTGNNEGWAKMEAAKDTAWIDEVIQRMQRYGISHASFNVDADPTPTARVRKPRAAKTGR